MTEVCAKWSEVKLDAWCKLAMAHSDIAIAIELSAVTVG